MKPFRLIVLGPPVSGKGTQTGMIAKTFSLPHISTGVILSNIKSDMENPLAEEVRGYMNSGQLVPTELVNRLVADRLKQDDCAGGFTMDGFPRTLEQAKFLSEQTELDFVISINVSDEAIVERISGRRVCKNGHTYHLKYSPPKDETVCDACGEPLFLRDDDRPETVKARLDVYHRETESILDFYRQSGKLLEINGEQKIDEVFQEIMGKIVGALRK